MSRNLVIIQWNVCGMRQGDLSQFIDALDNSGQWDIVCIQEFGTFSDRFLQQLPHLIDSLHRKTTWDQTYGLYCS